MHGILISEHNGPAVQGSRVAEGLETLTFNFLKQARQAALDRFDGFDGQPALANGCLTVQCSVPSRDGLPSSTGAIVVHISQPVLHAWTNASLGTLPQRNTHVIDQLRLVLKDLSDHDIHVQLAMTDDQRGIYDHDLEQLVAESLERTSFAGLGRLATVHWEGTLVRSMQPPAFVLVASIGFQGRPD